MEATCTQGAWCDLGSATGRARRVATSICTALAEIVAAGVRGDDFNRAFSSARGAQFAALPTSSKQRLLDRGFRA